MSSSTGLRKRAKGWTKEKTRALLNDTDTGKKIRAFILDGISSSSPLPQTTSLNTQPGTTNSPDRSTTKPGTSTTTSSRNPPATSPTSNDEPTYDGYQWTVPGVGTFKNKAVFTFENGLPYGLQISKYKVLDTEADGPFDHEFKESNVNIDKDGFLNLKVPGLPDAQAGKGETIGCAEVVTSATNILYASVRTEAIFSTVPGTCHGIFLYESDSQETDIEYLTDPSSQSNNVLDKNISCSTGDPIPIWYSNQATKLGGLATHDIGPAPQDVTAPHVYRIDWTKKHTVYWIDGVKQKTFTTNVPSKPGPWVWNNWANGDSGWSAGPPKEDNVMKILKITMYYNTSNAAAGES